MNTRPNDRPEPSDTGTPAVPTPLLSVQGLEAGYGGSQVLFGLGFDVAAGQFVTLLGRNGMGKSTCIKCLTGLLAASGGRIHGGRICLDGHDITRAPSYRIARAGVGLVPEGRQVFPNLTVRENLVATARAGAGTAAPWTLERVYELFPRLREREGHLGMNLSGGEQQMVAIGRALMTNPRLLILDEATEGLAPLVRAEIWQCLGLLRSLGMTILCVDKHLDALMGLADRHYIVEKGRVVWSGSSDELRAGREALQRHMGV